MDDRSSPTLMDLAKVLESPLTPEPYPESLATALWLIRQSPKAQALLDELHRERDDAPTLMELAKLLCAITSSARAPESQPTVLWLIRQSDAAAKTYACFDHMATDAGMLPTYPTWPTELVRMHQDVDRLLAAENWNDAAEILDPTGNSGPCYETWFNICLARLARGEGDRQRLESAAEKLKRNMDQERQVPTLDERVHQLKAWMAGFDDVESAAAMLQRMAGALRSLGRSRDLDLSATE